MRNDNWDSARPINDHHATQEGDCAVTSTLTSIEAIRLLVKAVASVLRVLIVSATSAKTGDHHVEEYASMHRLHLTCSPSNNRSAVIVVTIIKFPLS